MAGQQDAAPGGMLLDGGFDGRFRFCVGSHSHILAAEPDGGAGGAACQSKYRCRASGQPGWPNSIDGPSRRC
jgi:hypothetical protein